MVRDLLKHEDHRVRLRSAATLFEMAYWVPKYDEWGDPLDMSQAERQRLDAACWEAVAVVREELHAKDEKLRLMAVDVLRDAGQSTASAWSNLMAVLREEDTPRSRA